MRQRELQCVYDPNQSGHFVVCNIDVQTASISIMCPIGSTLPNVSEFDAQAIESLAIYCINQVRRVALVDSIDSLNKKESIIMKTSKIIYLNMALITRF